MTRRACTCPSCERSRVAPTIVRGGTEVRCPNGHASVQLEHGRDHRGRYLRAWCTAPGCDAKQLVRKPDQLEMSL